MNKGTLFRTLGCLLLLAFFTYRIIQKENAIHYLSLQIPKVNKELKTLEEENIKLRFEIDAFESPDHLFSLLKKATYSHLRHPSVQEVLALPQGIALKEGETFLPFKPQSVLAAGNY